MPRKPIKKAKVIPLHPQIEVLQNQISSRTNEVYGAINELSAEVTYLRREQRDTLLIAAGMLVCLVVLDWKLRKLQRAAKL